MRKTLILSLMIMGLYAHEGLAENRSCSINSMWTYKSKNDNPYLFPENLPKTPEKKTIDRIADWVKDNPSCKHNFWYDGRKVSNQQETKTRALLDSHNLQKVSLRNVRELDTIKTHEDIFSDAVPMYFQLDLGRAVVADDLLNEGSERYIIYVDFSIPPMENKLLLDERTVRVTGKVGIMLSKNHAPNGEPYENGFFIIDRDNKFIKDLHKQDIIVWALQKGASALKGGHWGSCEFNCIFFQYQTLWNNIWKKYSDTVPELKGKHAPISEIVKDVNQPVSHFSQLGESGPL